MKRFVSFLALLFFCLAARAQRITRGPYLQRAGQTTVTVKWRTAQPATTRLQYGPAAGPTILLTDTNQTTEHELVLRDLQPGTRYYYRAGNSRRLQAHSQHRYFETASPPTDTAALRIAVFGDCGRNYHGHQRGALRAYQQFVKEAPAPLLLLLGDNAYYSGKDREYTRRFFRPYDKNLLQNHVVFPAPGNHDYYAATQTSRSHAYYEAFVMPAQGESGGLPSGTEAYYAFDWGPVHFISLDSYGLEDGGTTRLSDTTGKQATWLKQDLAATRQPWKIVYFHHPPYSKGNHDADAEEELIRIRTQLTPLLERYGVDLVLSGHSHDYERSYPLKGYTGVASSFDVREQATTSSSGRYDGSLNSCPYRTDSTGGTVYVVAGSAGAGDRPQPSFPHPALPFAVADGGSFFIQVQENRLDARFLRRRNRPGDQFTILKGVGKMTRQAIAAGTAIQLTASWPGSYAWSTGATDRQITVKPTRDTIFTVTDGRGCVTDRFAITVK